MRRGAAVHFFPRDVPNEPNSKLNQSFVRYADYETAWVDAGCSNALPVPTGRQTYATHIECCNDVYFGQPSGKCLSELEAPPTTAPTMAGVGLELWYADYTDVWADGGCTNTIPVPAGRQTYTSHLECCSDSYAGQSSGKCLSELEAPPTTSPTTIGGLGLDWYPDYTDVWADGGCTNAIPVPAGRQTYKSQLECCSDSYAGQSSGKCLSELEAPPTTSPTITGGLGLEWYPDYTVVWADGGCLNALPVPVGGPTYRSQLECCNDYYDGQSSGKCLSELEAPPTASPIMTGGLGLDWYTDNLPKRSKLKRNKSNLR